MEYASIAIMLFVLIIVLIPAYMVIKFVKNNDGKSKSYTYETVTDENGNMIDKVIDNTSESA